MFTEDLAALDYLTEDTMLDELHERFRQGHFQTFVGDVLVILNPNEIQDIYGNLVSNNTLSINIEISLDIAIKCNVICR